MGKREGGQSKGEGERKREIKGGRMSNHCAGDTEPDVRIRRKGKCG